MSSNVDLQSLRFQVLTILGFTVRVTEAYWQIITTIKHPRIAEYESLVTMALSQPEIIRQSKQDPNVYLFYRGERPGRWVCAVAKRLNGDGFLITAYLTDAIKEGQPLWPY